jgi:hypothetical protein
MRHIVAGLVIMSATALAIAGCATGHADADAEKMAERLEDDYGIDDSVSVQTPAYNDDGDMSTTVSIDGCVVRIADTGYELVVTHIDDDPVGYPIDLESDGVSQLRDLCKDPDRVRWGLWS